MDGDVVGVVGDTVGVALSSFWSEAVVQSLDRSVQQTIEDLLANDGRLSAFHIQVESQNGWVTLRGCVPSARTKLAVQELVESTPGCCEVSNKLEVVPPGGVADDEIAESIRSMLERRSGITKGAITIHVEGGIVTLNGATATQAEYAVVEEVARSTRGVRDVHNLLIIDRDAQNEDESLQQEIQSALAAERDLHEMDIHVAVSGDLIVLSGHVRDQRQKVRAGEVTQRVRPWRLRNEIVVS
ncbi:MAG: BON domain-containing protein [Phycisphaerae bacterium]|nr:BON domain-containing protein [Phycisphaerae bacterium]